MSASRTEYKFIISTDQRDQLGEEIGMHLGADSAGIGGNYPIVSQYYDSPDRDCYWEKLRRLKSRRKIRIRMYGSDRAAIPPAAFVEIKHKLFGAGGKRRLQVSADVASGFVAGDQELLRDMVPEIGRSGRMIIAEIFDLVERYGHVPSMQIRYDRCAYTTEDGKFRVTFDSDLLCRHGKYPLRADDTTFVDQVLDPSQVMMEVKSVGSVPYWFRGWIAKSGLVRESFSKYCTSLERHDPVLRSMLRANA